jgi:hypothetical protein
MIIIDFDHFARRFISAEEIDQFFV